MTVTGDLFRPGDRGALLSACGSYRYQLWRVWDAAAPVMLWIMLNPSTADAVEDDQTIRKCVGFAKAHQQGGIRVVNLFAWRATDPRELQHVADPVGPDNDHHIGWTCDAPGVALVIAGWGADAFARDRAAAVTQLVRDAGRDVQCFRRSASGAPWHPLYLPYTAPLQSL